MPDQVGHDEDEAGHDGYCCFVGGSHWAEGSAGTPNLWPPSAA